MGKEDRVITSVDCADPSFINSFKKLPEDAKKEARTAIGSLILCDLDQMPAKLHLHILKGHPGVFSIHLTKDDRYKASFKMVKGIAVMRRCALHDELDKNP
jgi:hypothetical protein